MRHIRKTTDQAVCGSQVEESAGAAMDLVVATPDDGTAVIVETLDYCQACCDGLCRGYRRAAVWLAAVNWGSVDRETVHAVADYRYREQPWLLC